MTTNAEIRETLEMRAGPPPPDKFGAVMPARHGVPSAEVARYLVEVTPGREGYRLRIVRDGKLLFDAPADSERDVVKDLQTNVLADLWLDPPVRSRR